MEKNAKIAGIQQHEDAVLKASMQFFAEELLPFTKADLVPLILSPLMS